MRTSQLTPSFHRALWVSVVVVCAIAGCGDDDPTLGGSTRPLRILVTNDDGVAAAGIDAVVRGLAADAHNQVTVCAPAENRSGSSDATGPSERCGDLSVHAATTQSGYPATAVNGCPADTVNHALAAIYPPDAPPDLVVSGINEGQNIGFAVATRLSGTVGAAKTAARHGISALAASQGIPGTTGTYDYPTAVTVVLGWLAEHRSALLNETAPVSVTNLNVPSCATGTSTRGTVFGIALASTPGGALSTQDCASTLERPKDDTEGFLNGFITFSAVPY